MQRSAVVRQYMSAPEATAVISGVTDKSVHLANVPDDDLPQSAGKVFHPMLCAVQMHRAHAGHAQSTSVSGSPGAVHCTPLCTHKVTLGLLPSCTDACCDIQHQAKPQSPPGAGAPTCGLRPETAKWLEGKCLFMQCASNGCCMRRMTFANMQRTQRNNAAGDRESHKE